MAYPYSDMLHLDQVPIQRSPQDIASWPITLGIVGLNLHPSEGLQFVFDHEPPDSWKFASNPENAADNIQFTVWAVVHVRGFWRAAGFIQMWQGRSMTDGSLPAILAHYDLWWGVQASAMNIWSDYVPQPGDTIGFLVSAGNARNFDQVTSVRERSQVVVINLPAGDGGAFTFPPSVQPVPPVNPTPPSPPLPVPAPGPSPAPGVDLSGVLAAIADLKALIESQTYTAHTAIGTVVLHPSGGPR